jgi:hypothetical protein
MIGPNSSAQRYKINLVFEHLFLNKEVFILKNSPVSARSIKIDIHITRTSDGSFINSTTEVSTRTHNPEAEKTIMKKPFHLEVLSFMTCDLYRDAFTIWYKNILIPKNKSGQTEASKKTDTAFFSGPLRSDRIRDRPNPMFIQESSTTTIFPNGENSG